ncbi:hypothetical protein BH18THE2_BH18THE2_39700 [soil metagenome]
MIGAQNKLTETEAPPLHLAYQPARINKFLLHSTPEIHSVSNSSLVVILLRIFVVQGQLLILPRYPCRIIY